MSIKTTSQLITDANTFLPDNTTELISAKDGRDRIIDLADSNVNKTDGGLVLGALLGYSTPITPTSNYEFSTKKYVDDSVSAVDLTPFWRKDGNTLSAREIFGSIAGAFGYDEVMNGVVFGGVNNDTSRFAGTTASFADTSYSYKSLGSTSATYHTQLKNSSDISLFTVQNDGTLLIPFSFNLGIYGSNSETQGGLAYIIGNSAKAHPTNNNQVIKTTSDSGMWIRSRYDAGFTFHTGLSGAPGTLASDESNRRFSVDNNGNIGIGSSPDVGLGAGAIGIQDAVTIPSFTPVGGGILFERLGTLQHYTSSGSFKVLAGDTVSKSANYTALLTDETIICTANTFTINLYGAVNNKGRILTINNQGTGVITVDGNSTETINGALTQALNQYQSITIQSNDANWVIISKV